MFFIFVLILIGIVLFNVYLFHSKSPMNLQKFYLIDSYQFVVFTNFSMEQHGYTCINMYKDIFVDSDGILFLTKTNSAMKFLRVEDLEDFLKINNNTLEIDGLKYTITKHNNFVIRAEIL